MVTFRNVSMARLLKSAAIAGVCLFALLYGIQIRYISGGKKHENPNLPNPENVIKTYWRLILKAKTNQNTGLKLREVSLQDGQSDLIGASSNPTPIGQVPTEVIDSIPTKPAFLRFKLISKGDYDEKPKHLKNTSSLLVKDEYIKLKITNGFLFRKKAKLRTNNFPISSNINLTSEIKENTSTDAFQPNSSIPIKDNELNQKYKNQKAQIPHIIHQTWDWRNIPTIFVGWMQSWVRNHKDWEYWFWTQNDVRRFLRNCYPSFLDEYDSYEKDIYRANAMRYFIMYHFGGVYADLDLESLKPIDPWTYTEECILPEETYAHSVLLRKQNKSNVMITLLACRPRHPFFKLAIDMLPTYKNMSEDKKLFFVDDVYHNFISTNQTNRNSITIAHPDYFLPTFDKGWLLKILSSCLTLLPPNQKQICDLLKVDHLGNRPKAKSFTNHHWVHVVMQPESWKLHSIRPVSSIIHNAKDMDQILSNLNCNNRVH